MKISPRNGLIIMGAGFFLATVLIVVLMIVPQFGHMASLDNEIATTQQQVAVANSLLDQRRAIKDRMAETNSALIALATAMPANPELPSLLIDMQDEAYDAGVKLNRVAPDPITTATAGTYQVLPLKVDILGNWSDTIAFMQGVMKLTRGLRIQNFSSGVVNAASENAIPNQVATSFVIDAYVIPAGASAPAAAVPAPAPTAAK